MEEQFNIDEYENIQKLEKKMSKFKAASSKTKNINKKIYYLQKSIKYAEKLKKYCDQNNHKKYLFEMWENCHNSRGTFNFFDKLYKDLDNSKMDLELTNQILALVKRSPGITQIDVYKEIIFGDNKHLSYLIRLMAEENIIKKIKAKNTYSLYIITPENKKELAKLEEDSKINIKQKNNDKSKYMIIAPTLSNIKPQGKIKFPDWYVSISFGKSTSKSFPQAVALAKMSPQYIENEIEGKILHQAVYSHNPDEYLQFIKLYELVSKWKSCFVIINGQVIDRKIIGGLNYCYGDKCRSGNPDFCYGASYMTDNPFGCHRIQISRYNNPWWSFGIFDTSGIWHVDKKLFLRE